MAAALTVIQIMRIVGVGILRGIGDVRTPMVLAMVAVFLVNPASSYFLALVMSLGVWGASLLSQVLWLIGASVALRRRLQELVP